jgi:hypothetical protein
LTAGGAATFLSEVTRMNSEEILSEIEKSNEPAGLIVRSQDGRFFFLSEEEMKRTVLSAEDSERANDVLKKSGEGKLTAQLSKGSCGRLLQWLLNHNPRSTSWRRASVIWINEC